MSWETFKKRTPWIQDVLSRVSVKRYAATKDAAHIISALEEQEQLVGYFSYFSTLIKQEIDELESDIERLKDTIAELSKVRSELAKIENQLDKTILHLRGLKKQKRVQKITEYYIADQLNAAVLPLATAYANTKMQPEVVRRWEFLKEQINDAIDTMAQVKQVLQALESERKEEEKKGETE